MSCVRLALPIGLASLLLFSVPAAAETEMWTCKRADGTEVFTNKTKGLTGCGEYVLRSELGYVRKTVEAKTAEKEDRKPLPPQAQTTLPPLTIVIHNNITPPPPPKIEIGPPVGEIPFEVLRMLSIGMSEAEVLRRAGLPQSTLIGSYSLGSPYPFWPIFGANRFVYSSGDWVVELTFGGGRVLSINHFRPRP